MSRPITISIGTLKLTAQPDAMPRLIAQVRATKPMSVKAFRASVLRKQDKRVYPRFVEGQSTAEYVQAYWRLNGQQAGLVCSYNHRTGHTVKPDEADRLIHELYEPLGTTPQYTPLFDGVEESCE